jgi:TatD DNase family protein
VIPAVDAHAHLRPSLSADDVEGLGSPFVMAVTRSPAEWSSLLRRRDRRIAWGLGCHPADVSAIAAFSETKLAVVAGKATFFGEIGLDARSKVPAPDQERVLAAFLRVAASEGVITSIHSTGSTARVLDLIEETRPAGVLLHWWTGTPGDTARAIALGCHFSVNVAMRPDQLAQLPPDRLLTETDFPATSSRDRSVDRPGAVGSIEERLAAQIRCSIDDLREKEWAAIRLLDQNAGRLGQATGSVRSNPVPSATHRPA